MRIRIGTVCIVPLILGLFGDQLPAQLAGRAPHTDAFPNRNQFNLKRITYELREAFKGGGSPVEVGSFDQDEAKVIPLETLKAAGTSDGARAENGQITVDVGGGEFAPIGLGRKSPAISFAGKGYEIRDSKLMIDDGSGAKSCDRIGKDGLPDGNALGIALGPDGQLYVVTPSGIGILSAKDRWTHLTGRHGGLPVNDTRCVSFSEDRTMWVGTAVGAARRSPDGMWSYRMGPRWMIGDEVKDIIALKGGGAWILTEKSLTLLRPRKITLREKAKLYDDLTQLRHVRHGAITECYFRKADDPNSWTTGDNDNDGLWTSLYVAAKCFEYAATKDPEAKQLAERHFAFQERLQTITGTKGFIARSLRPSTFDPESHESYNYKGRGEWHESTVEPGWQWKADTSSDELSGHYFAWGIYYDLIAKGNPAEEARVRDIVLRVTHGLIDNDFMFLDIDGQPTRWGIYSPRLLNGDLMWSDENGLHSLCILAHLKVAMHIAPDDAKVREAYRKLVKEDRFDVNILHAKEMNPTTPFGWSNHSDDEMAYLAYYHLLLYDDADPELRAQYRFSVLQATKVELPEKSPFFNFVFAVAFPEIAPIKDGVDTLKRWPLDLRTWRTKNSHRDDVIPDPRRNRHGHPILIQPVEIDERVPARWNHDPYTADAGDDGRSEEEGAAWLMPYWMAVYHGFIVEGKS